MATKRGIPSWALAVIVVALLIVAGGAGYFVGSQVTPPAKPVLPDTIKIGVVAPMSGPIGPVGAPMVRGAELAAQLVNEAGGIGGRPIELIIEDTAGEPSKALDSVKKLYEIDGVQIIVGPVTSVEMIAIAPYVNERKVVTIGTICSAAKITEFGDDFVFRITDSDAITTVFYGEYIKRGNYERVAILTIADDWGIGVETGIKKAVPERVVTSIRIDPKKGDYRSELELIKGTNPDLIFYAVWIENGKIIFRQAMELGLENIATSSTNTVCDAKIFEEPNAAEYMAITNMSMPKAMAVEPFYYNAFSDAHERVFGEKPTLFTERYYDATMLAILAIARAGEYDGSKIKPALESVSQNYIGASGRLAMDKNGDLILSVYHIFRTVKTPDGKYDFELVGKWSITEGFIE